MEFVEWAKSELDRLVKDDDEMQKAINADILEIVEVFAKQGHSGFSGSYALSILTRLLDWKPITPLTGEDDEWNEVGEGVYQNKRCSSVFKENGQAYWMDGKIFSDDGGQTWWTNRNSRVPVTFPFTMPDHPEKVILTDGALT